MCQAGALPGILVGADQLAWAPSCRMLSAIIAGVRIKVPLPLLCNHREGYGATMPFTELSCALPVSRTLLC
jgi:hypothetical protein